MTTSELKVAEKWDTALEKGIKRTAYGAIAGGVVAALLFRKWSDPRSAHAPHAALRNDALTFHTRSLPCTTIATAGGVGIRSAILGLGSGIGVGITYAEAKRDFEDLAPQEAPAEGKI